MQKDWHITEGLITTHFVGLLVVMGNDPRWVYDTFAFIPATWSSHPWSVLTFQFITPSPIWFLFSMIILWLMGKTLENDWGSPRFLVFWLVSTIGAVAATTVLGGTLSGDIFRSASLLFTYATLYPDTELRLFFVLPVKVKWLAVFGAGGLVAMSLTGGFLYGLINIAGASAGYLFFLATRKLPTRRKIAFELKKRKASVEVKTESVKAEQRNQVWSPKIRDAVARSSQGGAVAAEDEALLAELDGGGDSSITICAASEFGYIEDDTCRTCPGFAECGARAIRMAAEGGEED